MAEEGDTIFAVASGAGVAGIAVIRISGPKADESLVEMTGRSLPRPRYAALRRLHDGAGEVLDEALVLRFRPGSSYTGEAVVELHCHGGRATVRSVLERLQEMPGCRMALPGEFTRRALEGGRMDLAEIEALGDMLTAETEAQRRQAMRGYAGALHAKVERWRSELVHALALIEATIDWADEEVPEDVGPDVFAMLGRLQRAIGTELEGFGAAEQLRSGLEVALVGAPNAGKSSLLNALAGREAAITSPVAGTTRDVIELRYDLDGLPVIFLDMAGVRETGEAIEALGVRRARERAQAAAIRVFLDAPDARLPDCARDLAQAGDLVLRSKADLGCSGGERGVIDAASDSVSVVTGEGLEGFLEQLRQRLWDRTGEVGLVGRLRQKRILEQVLASIGAATAGGEAELLSEHLREGIRAMDRLAGRTAVEDVLDEVFSAFCLGK